MLKIVTFILLTLVASCFSKRRIFIYFWVIVDVLYICYHNSVFEDNLVYLLFFYFAAILSFGPILLFVLIAAFYHF